MDRTVRPVAFGLVFACVVGAMVMGTALKSPCADGRWRDDIQYRELCYTDIVPLLGTEQLAGGRRPYLDPCRRIPGENCDEYPVITMYFIRTADWIARDRLPAFFYVNAALLLVCAVSIGVCLYVLTGRRALWFALAPTLLIYGTVNWDLLAVAFATGALLAFFTRRDMLAGVLLGLGAASKLYPVMLLVPLVAQRLEDREPDRAIGLGWATVGSWTAINLPFVIAAPRSWWEFFRFNATRCPDFDSLWYIGFRRAGGQSCLHTSTIDLASLVTFLGLVGLVWGWKRARNPEFPRWTLAFPIVVLFLLTSKVYSPQYGLWLIPLFPLAFPDLKGFVAFEIADIAVFVTRFRFFLHLDEPSQGTSQGTFEAMVLIRALVLVWCLVRWLRQEPAPTPVVRTQAAPVLAEAA